MSSAIHEAHLTRLQALDQETAEIDRAILPLLSLADCRRIRQGIMKRLTAYDRRFGDLKRNTLDMDRVRG